MQYITPEIYIDMEEGVQQSGSSSGADEGPRELSRRERGGRRAAGDI